MLWSPDLALYMPHLRAKMRRGRGMGEGKDYLPWLKVRDVPSKGTCGTYSGIRVRRTCHLLSELEQIYFLLVERKSSTLDHQEQFPILDVESTLKICTEVGVKHPSRGLNLEPLTIDFLITELTEQGIKVRAASIKTPEDAKNPQIRKGLLVQKLWCEKAGIPWTLVDTSGFNRTLLSNLRFIRSWHRHRFVPQVDEVERFTSQFMQEYQRNVPLKLLIARAAEVLHISTDLATDIFRYCTWSGSIPTSITHEIALNKPLILKPSHGINAL
jgi:hypothetical protein